MSGDHNRDDANRSVLWRDADGRRYLRTGDIGEFGRDGYLTLRGRTQDMILSGGFNVYPGDIETVLPSHPCLLYTSDAAGARSKVDLGGPRILKKKNIKKEKEKE